MKKPELREAVTRDATVQRELERSCRVYLEAAHEACPLTREWQNDGFWAHFELEAVDAFDLDVSLVASIAESVRKEILRRKRVQNYR